jgi:hypothetical protein
MQFVDTLKSTILFVQIWLKSRNIKKIKKYSKPLDKVKK